MPKIRRVGTLTQSRKATEKVIQNFLGLNTTYPYTQLRDSESPSLYNVRLYARNASDRRVAVGTRKGPAFYSTPVGETVDQQQTTTTSAGSQSMTTTNWVAKKFTAGATGRLTKVELNVRTGTTPTQHMMVYIYSDNSGTPGSAIASSSILSSSITSSYAYVSTRFIGSPQVTNGTSYWIVTAMQSGGTGTYQWSTTTAATTAKTSIDSGTSWSSTTFDLNAKTYVSTDKAVIGGFRYTPSNASATSVFATGTSLYTINESTGATTAIKSGLSSSASDYAFTQSNDILYYVNGFDFPRQWDGTSDQVVTNAPVISKFITFHKNRMWIVDKNNPTKIWFSDLGDYTTWTSTNFIYAPAPKSGDPITCLHVFQDNLVVFTRKTKYVLFGDDPGNFVLRQSSGKRGAVNQFCVASDPNFIYFLSDEGIYRYNGSSDELMSDTIQTEIDNIADKTKVAAVIQNNYYRLYYAKTGSTTNDSCILWDILNKVWLRDSNTFIDKPFTGESNTLYECSSRTGTVFRAEQQYSDLGRPIDFKYYTKYFGDGIHKIFMRRVIPSIRLQTQPYNLSVNIDINQQNNSSIRNTISAQSVGYTWGSGITWGSGKTWGSLNTSIPTVIAGTEAYWHQIRFEQNGVETPVEILSYILQLRTRRIE